MVTTYDLVANDLWDIWKPLVLEHPLNFFPAFQKAYKASEKFCFLVVFLQLGELQLHTSNIGIKTFKSHFVLEKVPKLAQLGKDGCFAYEDLMERGELTRVGQKPRYSGQQGLKMVQDFDVFNAKCFFLFCILLRVSRRGISSSVGLVLAIIDLEVVARELLGPADLFGAQALHLHESSEVVVVAKYKHLILRPF